MREDSNINTSNMQQLAGLQFLDTFFKMLNQSFVEDLRFNKEREAIERKTGDTGLLEFIMFYYIPRMAKISPEDVSFTDAIKLLLSYDYSFDEIGKLIDILCDKNSNLYLEVDKLIFLFSKTISQEEYSELQMNAPKKSLEKFEQSIPFTTDVLLNKAKTYTETEEWRCFLPRSKSISSSWNNDQKQWGKLCLAAVELSLEQEFKTAWELYQWLGYARYQTGIILEHNKDRNETYGRMRIDTFKGIRSTFTTDITDCVENNKYYDQYAECDRLLKELEQGDESNTVKKKSIFFDYNGKKIQKEIIIIMDPETGTSLSKFYRTSYKGTNIIRICHPPATRVVVIFAHHIEPAYQKLKFTHDQQEIYCLLGTIAYYLGQLALLESGSCAVSDLFTRRIMRQNKLPLQSYQGFLNWDLACMFNPNAKDFSQTYQNRFVVTPPKNGSNFQSSSNLFQNPIRKNDQTETCLEDIRKLFEI